MSSHRVQAGRLAGQELGGVEGPAGEAVAVQGPVREFEAFAHQAEDDGVLAGVVAGPEGVEADLAPGPLADQALAAVGEPVASRSSPARRSRPAGGAVPLGASFLNRWCRSTISMSAESPRARAASPTSFISRLTARLRLGEIRSGIRLGVPLELGLLLGLEPGRADDQRDAPRRGRPRRSPGARPGREKSITDVDAAVERRRRAGRPAAPRPTSGPTSSPSPGGRAGRSPRRASGAGSAWIRWISRAPIRPVAPWMPTRERCASPTVRSCPAIEDDGTGHDAGSRDVPSQCVGRLSRAASE